MKSQWGIGPGQIEGFCLRKRAGLPLPWDWRKAESEGTVWVVGNGGGG